MVSVNFLFHELMKYLALFDLDKTIYKGYSLIDFAIYEAKKSRISNEALERLQKIVNDYMKGHITYNIAGNKVIEIFAKSIQGIDSDLLYEDLVRYFEENKELFFEYFSEVLPELNAHYDVYLVTSSAQFMADAICKKFDLAGFISTEFEVVDNKFTGRITKSLFTGNEKLEVKHLLDKYGYKNSLAVGDSENDVSMLKLVENPICINASPELEKYAKENGWKSESIYTIENSLLALLKNLSYEN